MGTVPELAWCYDNDYIVLPPKKLYEPGSDVLVSRDRITALTFTITLQSDHSVIGAADRNGLNTNGVNISASGILTHTIYETDNMLAEVTAQEKRQVEYIIEVDNLHTFAVYSEYLVMKPNA